MSSTNPFNIMHERWEKAVSMKSPLDPIFFKNQIEIKFPRNSDRSDIAQAWKWLQTLKFNGREKNYLPHPVRVALYYLRYVKFSSAQGVVLSLLHNILEAAPIAPAELGRRFGAWVEKGCRSLAVDRARQKNEPGYLASYYAGLRAQALDVRLVKILDKLDNLLVLFLNPSAEVRAAYLDEVETFLLPIVREICPELTVTFECLTAESRLPAHTTLEDFLAQKTPSIREIL